MFPRKVLTIVGAMLLLICGQCLASEACRIANSIAIASVRLRTLTPNPDEQRTGAALARLSIVTKKCEAIAQRMVTPLDRDICSAIQDSVSHMSNLPANGVEDYFRATACRLSPASILPTGIQSVSDVIAATLTEQQVSDGESAYWIADDLLALVVLDPDEFLRVLSQHQNYQKRFFSDLGGWSLDDVGEDSPISHSEVSKRERVVCLAMERVQIEANTKDERALISKMRLIADCR